MNTAKKVLYTLTAGFALGAALGMLYAPDKGSETREKLGQLKRKLGLGSDDMEDIDKETLQELSVALQEQLDKVNRRLEK